METGFPLVMLLGPLVAAAAALVVRGRRRATALIGLVTVAVMTLLLGLASPGTGLFADNTLALFSREMALTPFSRSLFLFIYPASGVLFLIAWLRPAGRAFVPVGLAVLSPLAAAVMISPASLGAVFIVAAAAVVIPVLHGGHFEAASTAWRYFLMVAVALVPVLLTAAAPVSGALPSSWFWPLAATLIWLGGFPFHIWVTGLARHASWLALALLLGLVQVVVAVFLLNLLDSVPATRASAEFQSAIRWSAALTALLAAFLTFRATEQRGIIVGLVLLDVGLLPLAALSPGSDGLMIALPALIGRFLSLALITLALSLAPGEREFARPARWLAFLRPILLAYGSLSLIGLPLTPGFAGRWAQVAAIGQGASLWPPILVVIALAVATFALLRATPDLMMMEVGRKERGVTVTPYDIIILVSLLAISFLFGLFPTAATSIAAQMLGLG